MFCFFYLTNLLSAFLLMSETEGLLKSAVLVLLSLPMILNPLSFIPVLFVSSWSFSFVAFPGLAAFFYYYVLFFVSIVVSLIFNKQKVVSFVPKVLSARLVILFAIWIAVTSFYSLSGEWYEAVKLAIIILPLYLVSRIHLKEMSFCRTSIDIIAIFFSVYFLYIAMFAPIEYYSDLDNIAKSSLRSDMNPNTASQIVLIFFTILYCETFRTKKYWLMLFAVLNVGTLMYLGSRTAFFTMAIIAVVYLMLVLRTSIWKKSFLFVFFLALFVGIYSMGGRFESFERLSIATIEEDQGSGRFDNWDALFEDVIPYHLVKGIGVGKANYEYLPIISLDADNLYIDLITATGIIGLLLFFVYYFVNLILLFRSRKKKRNWDFLIAIFLAYLFVGLGETVYDSPMFWFFGFLSVFAINDLKYAEEVPSEVKPVLKIPKELTIPF